MWAAIAFAVLMRSSWYGAEFHGRRMANGKPFNMHAYTCAHRTLPLGTKLTLIHNGKSLQCVVTDRGPFVKGRSLDVSRAVAKDLGFLQKGCTTLSVERAS